MKLIYSYNNDMATYDDILALYNKRKTWIIRHLQFLAIEMYKSQKQT